MMKFIIGLVAVILIVPALLPSQFVVERQITIDSPQNDVYSDLVNLENWKQWSPWAEKEPEAVYEFQGVPGVVGSSTQWEGQVIGSGKQTLVALEASKYLETKLEFTAPNESEATGYMKLSEIEEGTRVTWGLKGDLSYPVERVFGLFMDSMVGKDFERGLEKLKRRLEGTL